MVEALLVTVFPVAFLGLLFIGGELFRRRHIDMDGDAPINRTLFYSSKYTIVVVWLTMVLSAWGVDLYFFEGPPSLKWAAACVWAFGFILLFTGRGRVRWPRLLKKIALCELQERGRRPGGSTRCTRPLVTG